MLGLSGGGGGGGGAGGGGSVRDLLSRFEARLTGLSASLFLRAKALISPLLLARLRD